MKKLLSVIIVFVFSLSVCGQNVVRVSELDISKMWQEYGEPRVGQTVSGERPFVNGKECANVIGTHAHSILKIDLRKDALRFRAQVGIPDTEIDVKDKNLIAVPLVDGTKLFFRKTEESKCFVGVTGTKGKIEKGTVRFVVKGDGKELYAGKVMKKGDAPVPVDVDVKGIHLLELLAEPTDDGVSDDQALWISPTLEYRSKMPETVDAEYAGNGPEMTKTVEERLKSKLKKLPLYTALPSEKTDFDWLLTPEKSEGAVYATADGKGIVVANALVSRTFRIFPNLATTDYVNRMTGESMLRAVSSEGIVNIDGKPYQIGGLSGQPERAYIKEAWLEEMRTIPGSFLVEDFEIRPLSESIRWARKSWALNKQAATGTEVVFTLRGEKELTDVLLKLHVAVYDQIPVIRKWFEVCNGASFSINVDSFKLEYLSFAEPESPGGGAAATLEPLSEHLFEYKTLMFQNYGAGVQACYRGPRLYDTEETKQAVIEIIDWYKKYRSILNSDIIHLRKPDARDWDGIMHVNPRLPEKGLAMFYNPTDKEMTRTVQLPLYYTGLDEVAHIREQEKGEWKSYRLRRDYSVEMTVTIPANRYTWFVIK